MYLLTSSTCTVGHNYALGKAASQSSTYNSLNAGLAVDGVTTLGRHSHTEFISNQWWKVDLGKAIIFQYARIYPRFATSKFTTNLTNR